MNALTRLAALRSANVALRNAANVHYTEGPLRWSGITERRKGWHGEYPRYADCSAFYSWLAWDATRAGDRPDFVNGANWTAGFTGTMTQHGELIDYSQLRISDAVFYGGSRSIPTHVAFYVGNGRVISHGSEAGPLLLPVGYRGDINQCRRYFP